MTKDKAKVEVEAEQSVHDHLNLDLSLNLDLACCRSGGIGRRKGLKIPRVHKACAGSIPASGTINRGLTRSLSLGGVVMFSPALPVLCLFSV